MATEQFVKQQTDLLKSRIHHDDPLATKQLSWDLTGKLLNSDLTLGKTIVLVCIGTDRSTGDCLGPLVGSKLSETNQSFYKVYGTLHNPVHAANLTTKLSEINNNFDNPLIIAVDACLGQLKNVGCVRTGFGALKPGAGVKKNLPAVGNINITGIVNVGGFMEYLVLQNTRLSLVMQIASLITDGLLETIVEYQRHSKTGNQVFR